VPAAAAAAATVAGPFGLVVLAPRTKLRDVALYAMQMWAFTVIHELPYDHPERLRARLRIRYPIRADLVIGRGELPNLRLQRALASPGRVRPLDRVLAFVHWAWFAEPHAALLWILLRREPHFPRAARQLAAAFDLGCAVYFLVPTAPPWWAAENGYIDEELARRAAANPAGAESGAHTESPSRRRGQGVLAQRSGAGAPEREQPAGGDFERLRRVMVEVGEQVWGDAWPGLYSALGGNPWAAMPSLHFATSLLAAILLAESAPGAGAVGSAYVAALAVALVYLGEHYAIDLIAGGALVAAVRLGEPLAAPAARALSTALQRLERTAGA
jgi:hypothetical protein